MGTTIRNYTSDPLVTVLMPVFNGEKYLKEAIESILSQTFKEFEFLIIDDGSNDGSAKILKAYNDSRIRLIANDGNLGLIATLNKGLEEARGDYIARMDCDDVADPLRLEKQLKVISEDSSILIVGTGMDLLNDGGEVLGYANVLERDEAIKRLMAVICPFVGPSTMFKKQVALETGGYNPEAYVAEDYDLWQRMASLGPYANINEPLYRYRINSLGESQTKAEIQRVNSAIVAEKQWNHFGVKGPAPIASWDSIWPKKSSVKMSENRLYYSNLHILFAEGYVAHGKRGVAFLHICSAWQWLPFSIDTYFWALMLFVPLNWFYALKNYISRKRKK